MTWFEYLYLLAQPFLPYHLVRVRKDIKELVSRYPSPVKLLDVGARKSHYTIGITCDVYLLDVVRETLLQKQLGLGITEDILTQLLRRRSNVRDYWIQDFLAVDLPAGHFEMVTAIEVFEHIKEPDLFAEKVCQVLRPGGVFYMTTPNGAAVENRNPDHFHHYTAQELESVLARYFSNVQVVHGEIMSARWKKGLGFWTPKQPVSMMASIIANLISQIENKKIRPTPLNSARLFASAFTDSNE